jgi:hypothetical protein
MVRHESMSGDELQSLHEPAASDSIEDATHTDKFRAQMHNSQRLNEYYNQVVAEILASLERVQDEAS